MSRVELAVDDPREWVYRAACRDADPEVFFPTGHRRRGAAADLSPAS